MAFDLDDLLGCLDLSPVDGDPATVSGSNLDLGYYRIFGGQILAQTIAAATAAAPGKSVKSLHMLFPREGDATKPLHYRVNKVQDGRTFGTTEVVGSQDGKVVAAALVSMHVDEEGLYRTDLAPVVDGHDAAVPVSLDMIPWEVRVVDGVDLSDRAAGPPRLELWMRADVARDERFVHQALLAHATDLTLIGTALRPFDGISQADSTKTLHTAVTSHTLWFHQPFSLDDWLLVAQHSPVVANGRGFGRGDVFSAAGDLVATFAQESMLRSVPA